METLKADYFDAICELARAKRPVGQFGIDYELLKSIRWYMDAPDEYRLLIYKALRKEVLDARVTF